MVVIVMGVTGAGKSTIGRALAAALGWEFRDGDDLHSEESKRKMHRGEALTDLDRRRGFLRSPRSLGRCCRRG
jgi:gluconokinase